MSSSPHTSLDTSTHTGKNVSVRHCSWVTFFCTNDIPICIGGDWYQHHEVLVASGDDLPAFGYVVGVGDDEGARARVGQATRPLDDVRVVVLPGSLGSCCCGCAVAIEAVAPFECAVLSGRVHHLLAVANGGVSHRLHARLAHQGPGHSRRVRCLCLRHSPACRFGV